MSLRVLSEDDLRFFEENGYVVVPNAVPAENCEAVIDAIYEFLEFDKNSPDDWYRAPHSPGGMVEMYQHPALWANRQSERIHGAMTDLFGTEKLWVSIDRANMKLPSRPDKPDWDNVGFMHWDSDVTHAATAPFGVQGVLYLRDTTEEMGGFRCAPKHHKVVKEWAQNVTPGSDAKPDMSHVAVEPIPGKQGDYVIWNRLLYHGNGHNRSNQPRFAQYISMFRAPAPGTTDPAWLDRQEDRIHRWRERLAPDAKWVRGDPRGREQTHQKTAELSPLGRKLLGLDSWE
jgi:hypothetical protein